MYFEIKRWNRQRDTWLSFHFYEDEKTTSDFWKGRNWKFFRLKWQMSIAITYAFRYKRRVFCVLWYYPKIITQIKRGPRDPLDFLPEPYRSEMRREVEIYKQGSPLKPLREHQKLKREILDRKRDARHSRKKLPKGK